MVVEATRRWWKRHGIMAVLATLALGGAIATRQSQGGVLAEAYAFLSAPFRSTVDVEAILQASALQEMRSQVAELRHQNYELQRLLGFRDQLGETAIPAPVVGRSADAWWHQLTLGRGSREGVKVGDVVMAPGGLIGRVEAVTPHTSRIVLVSDPTSRVGVVLTRTRAMGVLRGQGSHIATLEFFDKEPEVQLGDSVVTSGLSSLYPGSLVLGRVRSVDLDASPAPTAVVELSAPLSLLEWGLIYAYEDTPQLTP